MLEYRRTMKKARGMTAVLGLCMAVAGTSVSYASASGNTGDSGYESSQEHTESAGAPDSLRLDLIGELSRLLQKKEG